MEENLKNLINYRIQRCVEDFEAATLLFENRKYLAATNRLYYSIFHISNALLSLDGFYPKTHSGFISIFGQQYVNTGIFDKKFARTLQLIEKYRTKSDYDDFFDIDEKTVGDIKELAKEYIQKVKEYIFTKHQPC